MNRSRTHSLIAAGALAAFSFAGAGVASASTDTTAPADTMAEGDMAGPSGPLCAAVPAEGTGSVDSMAAQPVATAASENPLLTTLVAAVTAAELGDTLNSGEAFTVFAPINSAFDKVDPATLEAALADPAGLLSTVLTYHVIPEQLSSTQLVEGGSFATVQGEEVAVEMRGETLVINGGAAAAQCIDVPTANATVFLIDSVLLPPSVAEAAAEAPATTDTMATETTAAG